MWNHQAHILYHGTIHVIKIISLTSLNCILVPSILLNHIHKHFKSIFIIAIKSYIFEWLLDDSKQKIGNYKTVKIIKNRFTSKLHTNPIHTQIWEYLTPLATTCRGLILSRSVQTYKITTHRDQYQNYRTLYAIICWPYLMFNDDYYRGLFMPITS